MYVYSFVTRDAKVRQEEQGSEAILYIKVYTIEGWPLGKWGSCHLRVNKPSIRCAWVRCSVRFGNRKTKSDHS
jgi:hypothetical protein